MSAPVRVVVFGAHPDDAEIKVGGTVAAWAARGDGVLLVSLTDGSAGHHVLPPAALAARRRSEAATAATVLGARSLVLDHPDGLLQPTLELRREVIGIIRAAHADLVLLPRPWDYHPDHRATAQVVQDAAYLVTVPHLFPEQPALQRNPVFAFVADGFTRPCPFQPDVAVDTTAWSERKLQALHRHASQVYEWLPQHDGRAAEVPSAEGARLAWLRQWLEADAACADRYRGVLDAWYGPQAARGAQFAEVFEICAWGACPGADVLRHLFPLPGATA